MSLFNANKPQNIIGLDIGSASIKLVEIQKDNSTAQLITYGITEQSRDIIKSDPLKAKDDIIKIIKDLLNQARVTTDRVTSVLPGFSVFCSIVQIPPMSNKEITSAIQWEAKKLVPIPSEEMILDWKIIDQPDIKNDGEKKKISIILTATSKNIVNHYVDIINKSELELVALETPSFALQRSLAPNNPESLLILNIGAVYTNIDIINKGIPVVNKTIDIGGATITKNIVSTFNINKARAEQFKLDFGLMDKGSQTTQVKSSVEFIINSLISEIKQVMNIYQRRHNEPLKKVIISGGSSLLLGLPDYLEQNLNLKVQVGNPWQNISYPQDLEASLEKIGPRMAIAIGLALRQSK